MVGAAHASKAPYAFEVLAQDSGTPARCGRVVTPHGAFRTPAFMPVGTQATVKGLLPEQVTATGAEIILANTYHLHLRPGEELVREMGGLHDFMRWDGPILTDSGGYQVFSLSDLRRITDEGVEFKSHLDGAPCFLGPKEAMYIQTCLGADIVMSFDECMPHPIERSDAERSLDRTLRWEEETLEYHPKEGRALFGIVQGGVYEDLRLRSTRALLDMPFDGYAMGGLFIGEHRDAAMAMLEVVGDAIPDRFARYVMGVGTPLEVLDCIARGWDMFDCVLPTRNGRHGYAMTFSGMRKLRNLKYKNDPRPLEDDCPCLACEKYSRSYLRHLVMAKETLGGTLVSHHNLTFMQRLMTGAREAIEAGRLASYRDGFEASWSST